MQAANISLSCYNYELTYQKVHSYNQRDGIQESKSLEDKGYRVSITAEFQADSQNATYTRDGNKVNKNSGKNEIKNSPVDSSKSLGATKAEIKKQIELQTYQLLKQYLGTSRKSGQNVRLTAGR